MVAIMGNDASAHLGKETTVALDGIFSSRKKNEIKYFYVPREMPRISFESA